MLNSLRTHPRRYGLLVAAIAVAALGAAFIMQYGFDLYPCTLCIYQRYPYAIIALLGLSAAAEHRASYRKAIFVMIAFALLVEIGLAGYHAGVEQGIFEGTSSCAPDTSSLEATLDDLRAMITAAPIASCKDAAAKLFGLSITMWNGLFAFGLLIAHLTYMRYQHPKRKDMEL